MRAAYSDDCVRFLRVLSDEIERTGRRHRAVVDEDALEAAHGGQRLRRLLRERRRVTLRLQGCAEGFYEPAPPAACQAAYSSVK